MIHSYLDINGSEFEALTRDLLAEGNMVRFRAKGFSMRPFIRSGDILEVQPFVAAHPVRIGEIVLFKSVNNGLLAHRIIKITPEQYSIMYLPQGDSNRYPDLPISPAQILGIVAALKRNKHRVNLNTSSQKFVARLWVLFAPLIKHLYFFITGTNLYRKVRAYK